MKLFKHIAVLSAAMLMAGATAANAEDAWPEERVRIAVPFSAGGVADVISRTMGKEFSKNWDVPVIVENVPGANGNIGMGEVNRKPADGYNIILAPNGNLTMNPHLFKELPFDVQKDIQPVVLVASSDNILVTSSESGIKNFEEFVRFTQDNSEGFTYASPGVGSTHHLGGVLLAKELGVDGLHVPYPGFSPALNDVGSGEVDVMFVSVSTAKPQIDAGRIVPLAVASAERSPAFPDVPTVQELGYPDFEAVSWYSFVVRKGTPEHIVDKIYQTAKVSLEEIQETIDTLGLNASGMGPDELAELIVRDDQRWGSVIAEVGLEKQ